MTDRLTVYPEGDTSGLTLSSQNHLATGGEGVLYAKNQVVYKIYLDPSKAVKNGVDKKISLLKSLAHPGIIVPTGLLRDKAGRFIGLSMPQVTGESLCSAFTASGRDRLNFGVDQTVHVVDAMREITRHAHSHHALTVDANELNWLLKGNEPVAIDVDSWQMPGFPARAIMPSIRDYQMDRTIGFTINTDWFAWAVVTFQLWTGIHPYKGTHPSFGRGDLEGRMKAQASVFDKGVRLPSAVRDIQEIPSRLKNWYEEVFSTSFRSEPPLAASSVIASYSPKTLRVIQKKSAFVKLEKIKSFSSPVKISSNGFVLAGDEKNLAIWDALTSPPSPLNRLPTDWGFDFFQGRLALARIGCARVAIRLDVKTKTLTACDLNGSSQASMKTHGSRLWQSHNRVFILVEEDEKGLHEIDFSQIGGHLIVGQKQRWSVSSKSTRFLKNVYIQDAAGALFVGVATSNGFIQAAAPCLRGYRIAEGFAADEHNIWLTATRVKDGESVRLHLAWISGVFEVLNETLVGTLTLEAAMTNSGVGVLRDDDDIFATKGKGSRRVSNTGLMSDLRLFPMGESIGAFLGCDVFKLSLV